MGWLIFVVFRGGFLANDNVAWWLPWSGVLGFWNSVQVVFLYVVFIVVMLL